MATPQDVTGGRPSSRELIGREGDLAHLEGMLGSAIEGNAVVTVFVEGPAGIGKTRTVTELAARARAQGADVLIGRCVAHGEQILPYAPIVEVLTGLVRRHGGATIRELAGPTADELARLVPALSATQLPDAVPASASRLFQAIVSVLDNLSRLQPIVMVVEDLHWADGSTREMLALASHQLHGNLLLILTLRTDEMPDDPGIVRFHAEMGRGAGQRLVLQPLSREQQARQISDIRGVPPRSELLDEIYARAEGNPFFAEELLALTDHEEMPTTVRDLLLARLEALPPATRQVLRTASVIGRRFHYRLLDAVSDASDSQLEAALRSAVEHHVLEIDETSHGVFRFRHALLQEAIGSGLLPGEAARFHHRLAETLTDEPEIGGDATFVQGRIALHWQAAGEKPRALTASVAAAEAAAEALAFGESLKHYENAVALLDLLPDGEDLLERPRYRLLWAAADVAHLAAHPHRAAELVRAAIASVDTAQKHHHAFLYERLGRFLWMSAEGEAALAAYTTAAELMPAGATLWRAAVLSGYSQVLMLASRYEESAPLAREAIDIARQVDGGRAVEGHARNNLGVDLAHLGQVDAGVDQLLQARRIAEEEFTDVDDIARAIVNLESVLFGAGRIVEAAKVAIEGIGVVERLGLQRRKGVWCRCDAADILVSLGENLRARELLEEATLLAPQGIDAVRTDMTWGLLLLRLGDLDGAEKHLRAARRDGGKILDGQLLGPLYATSVEVLIWQRELAGATGLAEEGRSRMHPVEDVSYCVPVFGAATTAAAELALQGSNDAVEAARQWVSLSEEALERAAVRPPMAVAHAAQAKCELQRAEGTPDAAAWAAVATLWDDIKEPYYAAYARLRAAEARLGAGNDRDTASTELNAGWSDANRIGATQLSALIGDVARRARIPVGDPVETSGPGAFAITPREGEVLALVANGLTDRLIGEQLFISHRTVERHVSNLLAKLGAKRRSELTAMAHRLGLTTS